MSLEPTEATNPYQPPEATAGPPWANLGNTDAGTIRTASLQQEATVRSIGNFLIWVAILAGTYVALIGLILAKIFHSDIQPSQAWTSGVVALTATIACGLLGFGLDRLRRWARLGTLIVMGSTLLVEAGWLILLFVGVVAWPYAPGPIMLPAIHLATLILSAWRLANPTTDRVCRAEYRAVVQSTPEIQCPTDRNIESLTAILFVLALAIFGSLLPYEFLGWH